MPLIPRNRGESALHLAAQWGIIPLLAQRHPSVLIPEIFTELRDRRGATPLHWAATGGHLDQVLAVCPGLTADDLDLRDSRGATLLHYAAAGSHLAEFVAHYPRELTPEDFLVPDDDDQTPLADAAHSGQLDHVCPGVLTPENLLKEGLAPPPLELAILGGHLPQVIRLCPGAVTPEILTKGPNLLAAATSGHLTPAHGIDVGVVTATALMVPDDQGVTPLHRAVELGHLDQVLQICPEVITPENLAVGDNEGIRPCIGRQAPPTSLSPSVMPECARPKVPAEAEQHRRNPPALGGGEWGLESDPAHRPGHPPREPARPLDP